MLNKICIMGKFPNHENFKFQFYPEHDGKRAFFVGALSVKRNYTFKDEQYPREDIFELHAHGKTAEFINNYFGKGSNILVEGSLEMTETRELEDGRKMYGRAVIVADNVHFVDPKKQNAATDSQPAAQVSAPAAPRTRIPMGQKPAMRQ